MFNRYLYLWVFCLISMLQKYPLLPIKTVVQSHALICPVKHWIFLQGFVQETWIIGIAKHKWKRNYLNIANGMVITKDKTINLHWWLKQNQLKTISYCITKYYPSIFERLTLILSWPWEANRKYKRWSCRL